ncbi:MAG: RNA polymerase sigma factor [Desulfomonilaceae bacterium]
MITTNGLPAVPVKEEYPVSEPLPEDMEDIRLSLAGENDAYARLVERYELMIAARMWRFTRDRTVHRELVQDVFVEAFFSLRTFRGAAPFERWLNRIATRVGYHYWRQKRRYKSNQNVSLEDWDQSMLQEHEPTEPEKAAEILHALLAKLPPRDRLVVMLRYVENRSVEETAALIGWTQTMVKVQAWRARNKLKKLFEAAGLEVDR